ncbi:zinc-dependent alcohol dehydrogenase [Salinirarus marinus]|uniref:zinc-dependent alcohol dehydrogenase n=1 Tax=Salinirarus marinus TaxID=3068310 RepID=UPI003C6BDB28
MRATALYFTGPRQVGVEEVAVPDPARDEVLVETSVSAVSGGTELLVYRGEAPEETDVDATIDALAGEFSYPFQYGYSAVGDVVALGADIDDRWRGRTVFAFNPHESHFTATPEQLFPVPADVSPETASLLPTAETAVTLVMDGRPMVGERVVVFGAGVVGLFTAKLLASFPLERLTVVEPVASRRRLADRMGADETFHPDRMDDVGERGDPPGVDLVYELTGCPAVLNDAIDAVGYDGRVVVGSWYGRKRADVALGEFFHRGRVDVVSSQVSTLAPDHRGRWTKSRRIQTAWEYLRRIETDRVVTHRLPFERAPDAYRELDESPDNALQVILQFE